MTAETVVFWDIDGTLLSTARAGVGALEDAAREVLGATVDLSDLQTMGLTDPMIARAIIELVGAPTDDLELERAFLQCYTDRLPSRLNDRRGGVMPSVTAVLDALSTRSDVVLALLTGNMRAGATAKLASYGLDRYFSLGGYGDDGFTRIEIGRAALAKVASAHPEVDEQRRYLVGDTPSDIECGSALGMRTIAVATGVHSFTQLEACGAWWTVAQLPDPAEFLLRVGLT